MSVFTGGIHLCLLAYGLYNALRWLCEVQVCGLLGWSSILLAMLGTLYVCLNSGLGTANGVMEWFSRNPIQIGNTLLALFGDHVDWEGSDDGSSDETYKSMPAGKQSRSDMIKRRFRDRKVDTMDAISENSKEDESLNTSEHKYRSRNEPTPAHHRQKFAAALHTPNQDLLEEKSKIKNTLEDKLKEALGIPVASGEKGALVDLYKPKFMIKGSPCNSCGGDDQACRKIRSQQKILHRKLRESQTRELPNLKRPQLITPIDLPSVFHQAASEKKSMDTVLQKKIPAHLESIEAALSGLRANLYQVYSEFHNVKRAYDPKRNLLIWRLKRQIRQLRFDMGHNSASPISSGEFDSMSLCSPATSEGSAARDDTPYSSRPGWMQREPCTMMGAFTEDSEIHLAANPRKNPILTPPKSPPRTPLMPLSYGRTPTPAPPTSPRSPPQQPALDLDPPISEHGESEDEQLCMSTKADWDDSRSCRSPFDEQISYSSSGKIGPWWHSSHCTDSSTSAQTARGNSSPLPLPSRPMTQRVQGLLKEPLTNADEVMALFAVEREREQLDVDIVRDMVPRIPPLRITSSRDLGLDLPAILAGLPKPPAVTESQDQHASFCREKSTCEYGVAGWISFVCSSHSEQGAPSHVEQQIYEEEGGAAEKSTIPDTTRNTRTRPTNFIAPPLVLTCEPQVQQQKMIREGNSKRETERWLEKVLCR